MVTAGSAINNLDVGLEGHPKAGGPADRVMVVNRT
jgi:hypothetical protein